jgi:hypothetical protein
MGDKVAARLAATSAGLPIIPGTDTAIATAEVIFIFLKKNGPSQNCLLRSKVKLSRVQFKFHRWLLFLCLYHLFMDYQ